MYIYLYIYSNTYIYIYMLEYNTSGLPSISINMKSGSRR